VRRWMVWLGIVVLWGAVAVHADEYDDFLRPGGVSQNDAASIPGPVPGNRPPSPSVGLVEVPMDVSQAAYLQAAMQPVQPQANSYRIGPFDVLELSVLDAPELTREERVNAEGQISVPLIGTIHVAGLTPQEVEALLARLLGEKYFQDPQVNVYVKEFNSQRITVYGLVKKPGVYSLSGETSLMDALALAGGLDEMANESKVLILRPDEKQRLRAFVVDLKKVQAGEMKDPPVYANDRIVVDRSGFKAFKKNLREGLQSLYFLWPFLL